MFQTDRLGIHIIFGSNALPAKWALQEYVSHAAHIIPLELPHCLQSVLAMDSSLNDILQAKSII